MDNQQGPTVWHMELCSISCGSLGGRGVWARMDSCTWTAESLRSSPETITTLLIGCTPIQHQKFKEMFGEHAHSTRLKIRTVGQCIQVSHPPIPLPCSPVFSNRPRRGPGPLSAAAASPPCVSFTQTSRLHVFGPFHSLSLIW